jgi:uncharacterized protein
VNNYAEPVTMTERDFISLQNKMLAELDGLSTQLTYHSKAHTMDVIAQSERIAKAEGITAAQDLLLLKTAALFHDTGFLYTYANHEERGCELFLEHTTGFSLDTTEKEIVMGLIMATKIPQQPVTHLQQVICDADLDYLGRDDFFEIAEGLRKEFLHYGIVADDAAWEKMQLNFLKNHQYHTASSQLLREPGKQAHLQSL